VPIFSGNLVDTVWGEERPAAPKGAIEVHPLEWAGASVKDKVERLNKEVEEAGGDTLLV
jgi:Xaa-Pro aminopeptidase